MVGMRMDVRRGLGIPTFVPLAFARVLITRIGYVLYNRRGL